MANNDVLKWSINEVVHWAETDELTKEYPLLATTLREQDFNGRALLRLTIDDLKDPNGTFKFKAGPASNIAEAISKLTPNASNQNIQVPNTAPPQDGPITDATLEVLEQLLRPLTTFPRKFDPVEVKKMLETPVTTKIFSTEAPRTQEERAYLQHHNDKTCPLLASIAKLAMSGEIIPGDGASEMEWSGYWDVFFMGTFLRLATREQLREVTFHRNVEDQSSTQNRLKRDFLLWARNVLLFAGEDKPTYREAAEARGELLAKMKACAVLYGELQYFLAYTTAGPYIEFFAIKFIPGADVTQNQPQFEIHELGLRFNVTGTARVQAFRSLLNVCRWVRSVIASDILDMFAISMTDPETRDNPYNHEPTTTVINKGAYFQKNFFLPNNQIDRFERVYAALQGLNSTNCCKLKDLRVAKTKTANGNSRLEFLGKNVVIDSLKPGGVWITLQLIPVGSRRTPSGEEAIFECFLDILSFLAVFHEQGLTHYDLRWSNILRSLEGKWFVVDFENAGPIGDFPWWESTYLNVFRNIARSVSVDLFQVGLLLEGTGAFTEVSSALKHNRYATAMQACEALRSFANPAWKPTLMAVLAAIATSCSIILQLVLGAPKWFIEKNHTSIE